MPPLPSPPFPYLEEKDKLKMLKKNQSQYMNILFGISSS